MSEVAKESRLGKQPIAVPSGVNVTVNGQTVTVKGPKGELSRTFDDAIAVSQEDGKIVVKKKNGSGKRGVQFQGLTRALVANAVQGVHEGYKTSLDLYGVGYRATVKGTELDLALGLSHHVIYDLPKSVSAKVETIDEGGVKRPRLHLESYDNEALGQVAARIKSFRPPEPYKGKGVRFTGERIRQKAGKAGGK